MTLRTLLTLFIASVFLSASAFGQNIGILSIDIIPSNPSEGDSVYLVTEVLLPHSGCYLYPSPLGVELSGDTVVVDALYHSGALAMTRNYGYDHAWCI